MHPIAIQTIAVLAGSMGLSAILTPIVCRTAGRWGLVDAPDKERKTHGRVVPLSCGVPVLLPFAALIAVMTGLGLFGIHIQSFSLALLGAAVCLTFVGLLDDRYALRGRQKLIGQLVAATLLVYSGNLEVRTLALFGHGIPLGILATPFTIFWLVGAINAFNLIDGIDGLASGVGIIISAALGCMSLMYGRHEVAMLAFCVTGSLVGFLFYNFPPAKIFLGDTGSMLIGLLLGSIAIKASLKGPATAALVIPTAIWAVPIFDVSVAILRRKLTGRSLYDTDHGHLHHCLMRRSNNNGTRTLAIVGVLCLLTGAGALVSVAMGSELMAVGAAIMMALILVASRSFGHTEFRMLANRLTHFGTSMIPTRPTVRRSDAGLTRFQGSGDWDHLWSTLKDFAVEFDLDSVELNVNLPAIGEEHHAKWAAPVAFDPNRNWKTDIPLVVSGQKVGHLKISGSMADESFCDWIGQLIEGLKPFESQLGELVGASYSRQDVATVKMPAVAG